MGQGLKSTELLAKDLSGSLSPSQSLPVESQLPYVSRHTTQSSLELFLKHFINPPDPGSVSTFLSRKSNSESLDPGVNRTRDLP